MINMFGCKWEVVKRYELTDEYMRDHGLNNKKRITIRCVESNGFIAVGETRDFANTANL